MSTQLARKKPLLVREEQTLLHRRPRFRRFLKAAVLGPILRRSYALYIGTENRRWFASYGVPADRQFFVPYSIDTERFLRDAAQLAPHRNDLRRAFGLSDLSSPVIVTVARLIPKKQPHVLLKAFMEVRKRRRCSLLFVGSGELESELRDYACRHKIRDVVFTGFVNQSDISRAYAAADIFALPSGFDETWGLAVNEAMSFGLPVVVSDKVGSSTDLVRDGVNGYVVPSTDVDALADRLEQLVVSDELRRSFQAASRQMVCEFASYDVAAEGVRRAVAAAVGPERWAAATEIAEDVQPHAVSETPMSREVTLGDRAL
jgi:glycosyltransferase involved in cell wall biosynthesis